MKFSNILTLWLFMISFRIYLECEVIPNLFSKALEFQKKQLDRLDQRLNEELVKRKLEEQRASPQTVKE